MSLTVRCQILKTQCCTFHKYCISPCSGSSQGSGSRDSLLLSILVPPLILLVRVHIAGNSWQTMLGDSQRPSEIIESPLRPRATWVQRFQPSCSNFYIALRKHCQTLFKATCICLCSSHPIQDHSVPLGSIRETVLQLGELLYQQLQRTI